MTEELDLGINMNSGTSVEIYNTYIDNLILNNFTEMRVSLRGYENEADFNLSKEHSNCIVAKGSRSIWGCTASTTLTAANWNDYRLAVLDAAAWAEANGVYEFQLGNELEYKTDNTTLTHDQLVINLKSLATEVKLIFTRGNISYSACQQHIDHWYSAGKGDIDLIAFNDYIGSYAPFDINVFKDNITNLVNNFGISGCYLSEFSVSNISLDDYSTDESRQRDGIIEMIKYIKLSGIKRAFFFMYAGDTFGAYKTDGTPRKLWDVLKIQNDWKRRKTASKSGLGGLSHG
jgi:hypothetical protein